MLTNLTSQSAALRMFRRIPLSSAQTRFPVMSAIPTAYFVNGDTGLKQTTEVNWANKYINVEELAAIVSIPDNVLADTSFDVWGQIRPLLENAIGRALDAAIFFGADKPASWDAAIVTAAVAAGNVVARGTNTAAGGGVAGDFSDLFGLVEGDGYSVTGVIANTTYRGRLRNARGTDGQPLMDLNGGVFGVVPQYPMGGLFPTGVNAAEAIAGDFNQAIIGVRSDFDYKLSKDAVIQDNTGAIIFNSFQQDMTLMRVTFRVGFVVSNPINYDNAVEGTRYPFAILRSPAA
jgi:HK97 family phage major capsid protein